MSHFKPDTGGTLHINPHPTGVVALRVEPPEGETELVLDRTELALLGRYLIRLARTGVTK